MTPTINKTPLKWAGSKARIMNELRQYLPAGQRLVEPFGGACSVMMNTDYPKYLIADVNPDLINTLEMMAVASTELIDRAGGMFDYDNVADIYYSHRMDFNTTASDPLHRAAIFLYLNRHGYNGLCRYNQHGHFNVPFGNYKKPYFPEAEIDAFAKKAQHATFICASYEETLDMVTTGDVIYCDPPYDGTFSSYHASRFSEDDQYRLASILEHLADKGFPIIASNSDTPLVRSLYRDFAYHRVDVKRSISANTDSRKMPAAELIITANVVIPERTA